MEARPVLWIVIPCYNEEAVLPITAPLFLASYWKELSLALPKLPPHYVWKVCMDTEAEEGFLDRMLTPQDQHCVELAPRSVRILRAVPDTESIRREKAQERLEKLPDPASVLRDLKKNAGRKDVSFAKYPSRTLRLMKTMIPPKFR